MIDTAIMMFSYGADILDVSMSSIVKFFPNNPIYFIDGVESESCTCKGVRWQPYLKDRISTYLKPYGDRIKRLEWALDYSSQGGAPFFWRFICEYPQYSHILKTDDDIIFTDYGLIESLKNDLEEPNVLVASGLMPLQRQMPGILHDILNIDFHPIFYDRRMMEKCFKHVDVLAELWDKTFPPQKILSGLKTNPVGNVYPQFGPRFRWLSAHYLVKRSNYSRLVRKTSSDEREINDRHRRDGSKICINTHHLVYHQSWRQVKKWSDENINPLIRAETFWRI